MNNFSIRPAKPSDKNYIAVLYRSVAVIEGGLARAVDEITDDYLEHFFEKSLTGGLIFVAVHNYSGHIIGEIHAYRLGPRVFSHVLGELTIAVEPGQQGSGVGKALFTEFLRRVEQERPAVQRVELIARESNIRALAFYEKLGFRVEGRLEKRIGSVGGGYEADVMMAWLRQDKEGGEKVKV